MTRWTAAQLAPIIRQGAVICSFCRFPPNKCLCKSPLASPVDSTKGQATLIGDPVVKTIVDKLYGEPPRSFSIILPWPPTGNHGTKHTKSGKHYLTQAHRTYRSEVAYRVTQSRVLTIRGKYRMSVVCHPPDRRKRDFDNVQKTFCDALQHAQAIADDCYMRQLVVLWHDWSRSEPARIVVNVAELVVVDQAQPFTGLAAL